MAEENQRILLVDDVRVFRELERTFLKRTGYEILTASTGLEALEKARTYHPKLILLDLCMPGMDGAECCEQIKNDPDLKDIQVIIVSTRGQDDDRARCIEAGCDGYLTKPITRTELLKRIQRALYVEVRQTSRLPISIKVAYRVKDGPEQRGVTLTISAGGMFVVTQEPPQVGAPLKLAFELPGVERTFEPEAEVIWNTAAMKRGAITPGFGLRYTNIDTETFQFIDDYVEKRLD
jgi:uncharacterized protein (TIGR02266 family)